MSLVGEKEGGQRIQQGECLERNEGRARSASYFPCSRLEERSKHSQVTSVPPPINSAGIVNPVAGGVILIVGSLPRSRKLAIDDEGCSSPCDASSSVAESSMLPSSSTLASGSRAASEKHQEAKLAKFRSEEERGGEEKRGTTHATTSFLPNREGFPSPRTKPSSAWTVSDRVH